MSNPPNTIYLQWDPDASEVTWCGDRVDDDDIVYHRETGKRRIAQLEALIIESAAQFNQDKKPGISEFAELALVRMCSEGADALNQVEELKHENARITELAQDQAEVAIKRIGELEKELSDERAGRALLIKAGNDLLNSMQIQLDREEGRVFISSDTALKIWAERMSAWIDLVVRRE